MLISEAFQLYSLKDKFKDKKIPIKTALKFTRFFNSLEQDITFFNTTLKKILEEYGKKDSNGNYITTDDKSGIKIKEECYDECMEKILELNTLETENLYSPNFTEEELENLDLSISELSLLLPFIKE